jgi:predicted O-methyltransferase YrrM
VTQQGTGLYRGIAGYPPPVREALTIAERLEFTNSCAPEVGRLLYVLASHCRGRRIGEIGTGCGVGAAWMAAGMDPAARLVTVEIDLERATAARELFRAYPTVRVMMGDWRTLGAEGPFSLLFADGGRAKLQVNGVLSLLEPGGLVVIDDLMPGGLADNAGDSDRVRSGWFGRSDVAATELQLTPTAAALLATKLR